MGLALKKLSESDRIRIAESLFKVTSQDAAKGEIHGLCPIHEEHNPSFSYNFKKDTYSCFSCGASGDLLKLWSVARGYGQKDGFQAFCKEFGIEAKAGAGSFDHSLTGNADDPDSSPPGPDLENVWELFPPLPDSWIQKLETERGWSPKWIDILDLRQQTHYLDKKTGKLIKLKTPERIAIPVRDKSRKLRNIRLYKPGGGKYKIISWGKSYGSARLFPAGPLTDIKPVLLCEGESDTICALSHDFNAITQTSKLKNWKSSHLEPFKGREVVIAYDADQPGQKYAAFAAENLFGVAKSVKVLEWPDFMGCDKDGNLPEKHGEDLTDFFQKHGKNSSDLTALITAAKPYDPEATDTEPTAFRFFERGMNDRLSFKPRLLAEEAMSKYSLLSDPKTGLLYNWNDKFWDEFNEDHIKGACIRYLGNESQKSRVEDAVYQAKMLCTIPYGRAINDNEDWICIQNGMLNLQTLDIVPHEKEYYATFALPVSFDPDKIDDCKRWISYLEETVQTPAAMAQLQEFLGYCLLKSTKYEKCLILLGPGADGKSTFLKIMKEMVGDQNCAAVSFPDLEDQFQRSSLYGKLVNISTEIGAKAIESPYFKAITSGDPINAAFKHRNTFTFSPYCKLAFAGNRLPRVLDNSDGIFRRFLPVRFKRQFLDDADPDLFIKLKEELSGIFSWALLGLHRLLDQGKFTEGEETRELLMDYRRINNPVLCYVEDRCVLGEEHSIEKQTIYTDYKQYCSIKGYSALNEVNFFRELYVAVHNIRLYRPRTSEGRKNMLTGISLEMIHD
ncbi:MAG: DNA primase [Deltaproteobacteria bacterium]|nr:DNA primase [Deltaproteobacteria bacterium]